MLMIAAVISAASCMQAAGLAFFVLDDFALVADALALVRLRRLLGADLSSVLADLLLIDTGNSEVVGILPHDGAILGIGDVHLVGEAQVHDQVRARLPFHRTANPNICSSPPCRSAS